MKKNENEKIEEKIQTDKQSHNENEKANEYLNEEINKIQTNPVQEINNNNNNNKSKKEDEADFFKKSNDESGEICYYKIGNLQANENEDFKMNTNDILKLLKDHPEIYFALKNKELKTNSYLNLLKESDHISEKKLYDFKEIPDLKLKINKRKSTWGENTYLQVILLKNKETLFLTEYPLTENQNKKINLIARNLTLYKN
ncbi:MAG: hypothetical protein Q8781_02240 [Candidatus Phytoplasma stylosanthis]|uniref:hypothetical protein n=1 Tax=Candidatus Phytoplasma stylosanthis TaxID=2798314 RepID=UPI00293AFC82|nr:hypothetical protein [Candidatus Phytoplasma stylosanthis]MDV3168089.1 hypothetical protein [Candidatus Phytoplasma stylosanthis]MDV3171092.1 hypothetical protein [Candidatus Phytoplasma stylosanthis]MDV3173568.1 hypothetical protein [Candidatus Phytoplasma stylosanthis]MDV3174380.1 hypothetical protein [Candidatus Phytoplasma stylosanthis]MDV3202474.1 hypothetical protein [Candidatus Phytoplasma stylosanthis]